MRRIGALLVVVAGCSFSGPGDGNGGPDGGPGTDADGSTACMPWNTRAGHVPMPCNLLPGPAWVVTADTTFDTTSGTNTMETGPTGTEITQNGGGSLRVVSVDSFSVADGATLRVIGSRPLLVLSWSTMQVAGIIDVSSVRVGTTATPGAGANRPNCDSGNNGLGIQDSGGGGGGGFKVGGGDGGDGDGINNGGNGGGSSPRPMIVVGGCQGGAGGMNATLAGDAGASGGAIQLTAKTSIELTATAQINAGGMGGEGGQGEGGGGGGGSGGFIGLDAPMVTVGSGAQLAANGGGGGTGCDGNPGPHGANGIVGTTRALGGPATDCSNAVAGGRGGALGGGTQQDLGGEDGSNAPQNNISGGGGGGGVGYILVWTNALQFDGIASPAHQRVP